MTMSFVVNPANNDLVIHQGKLITVTGADEVRQRILIALKHDYQEYFLNAESGTPWYELILGNKNQAEVTAILRRIILTVPGVVSIVRFSIGVSDRQAVVNMSVEVEPSPGDSDILDIVANLTHTIAIL